VGGELRDCVFEGEQRVIGADRALRFRADLLQLAEDGSQSLVGLLLGLVGRRRQPVQAPGQGRGDHQDFFGGVDQQADPMWKSTGAGDRLAHGD
jgi:hypothetical protein